MATEDRRAPGRRGCDARTHVLHCEGDGLREALPLQGVLVSCVAAVTQRRHQQPGRNGCSRRDPAGCIQRVTENLISGRAQRSQSQRHGLGALDDPPGQQQVPGNGRTGDIWQ